MFSDFKFALRQLVKSPGFTAVAVLTLALGIGATTVTFSVVHAVLLRPFPAAAPERLVALNETNTAQGFSTGMSISYPNFVDWRRDNRTLATAALYEDASYTLTGDAAAEHLDGAITTAGFFETMGIAPALGRTFLPEEESASGRRVTVLSHETWLRRFNADPGVLGRTLRLDGEPHTIVGVMPPGFRFPDNAVLWTPLRVALTEDGRGSHSYDGVARLREGISLEQARLNLNAIAAGLATAHPLSNSHIGVLVTPFLESVTGAYGRIALILFGAVLCVLLITCVNLAGLLLARGATREREMALRAALGANRGRLVRQLLVENLVLGVLGGALAVFVANWGLDLVVRAVGDDLPYWMQFTLNGPVLAFAAGVSLLATLGFGLVPAWQLSRLNLNRSLKEGGRSGSTSRAGLMRLLVGAQLALALVLLTGAGLLVKSFLHLRSVRPGFDSEGVLTFNLTFPPAAYPDAAAQIRVGERIVENLQVLPGVESAALVSNLPLGGSNWGRGFGLAGRPAPEPGQTPVALNRVVSAAYFQTMHIPIMLGRSFNPADSTNSPRVAIVDESFARQYFPGQNPVGQRLHYGRTEGPDHPWMEIVGVVGDVRHHDLQNRTARAGLYVPAAQNTGEGSVFFVLRRAPSKADGRNGPVGDPAVLAGAVRRAVADVDRELAVADLQSMPARVQGAIWRDRFVGEVFSAFSVLALLLSALGVYGVTAFVTSQRTREIGVRIALGAQPGAVLRLVLGGGLRLAAVSLALGLVAALGLTQLLAQQLYEVSPLDPMILSGVPLLLAGVALFACWIPARRATKVDPLVALRAE